MNEQNLRPFKPGQSGNPNGRPRGGKNVRTVLMELLASQDPNHCYATPLSKKLLQLAYNKNNLNAIIEILDRIEGKVPNKQHISGDPENPYGVVINVNRPVVEKRVEENSGPGPGEVQSS